MSNELNRRAVKRILEASEKKTLSAIRKDWQNCVAFKEEQIREIQHRMYGSIEQLRESRGELRTQEYNLNNLVTQDDIPENKTVRKVIRDIENAVRDIMAARGYIENRKAEIHRIEDELAEAREVIGTIDKLSA
ncbi:hypothetical protein GF373_17560 [bacterium]|nr:hypothetical protein [bacterium]